MSTEIIVGMVGLGLFLLVAIALTMQTIEKNRKEKKRRMGMLKARVRNFEYMLNGFPPGFLNIGLQILVCKSLQEVFQQLSNLLPRDKSFRARSNLLTENIRQLAQNKGVHTPVTLTDKTQIAEVQKLLKGLFNFIGQLSASKRINPKDAHVYAAQIRRLMLQSTTDSLNAAIAAAMKIGKFRLALHNLKMATEKLEKENSNGEYNTQIANYQKQIQELAALTDSPNSAEARRKAAKESEWDEFTKTDETWKKKALYD